MADCSVLVRVDDFLSHGGNGEKCEHVAAGEGGDEGLFGIDLGGVA